MASDTSGVKPFSIQGRLYRERERLIGNFVLQQIFFVIPTML